MNGFMGMIISLTSLKIISIILFPLQILMNPKLGKCQIIVVVFFLSESTKEFLNYEFSKKEIKKMVFEMGKLKAPGPNGF